MIVPPQEQRETIHERPWAGHGPVAVHRHLGGRRAFWYAADDDGVLALGETREDVARVLRHSGVAGGGVATGNAPSAA